MARLSNEQKATKRAQERAEQDRKHKAFQLTLPTRMYELQQLAWQAQLETEVTLVPNGVLLKVRFSDYSETEVDSTKVEEWEFNETVDQVQLKVNEVLARERRRKLAQETLNALSEEQKEVLKEFGHLR